MTASSARQPATSWRSRHTCAFESSIAVRASVLIEGLASASSSSVSASSTWPRWTSASARFARMRGTSRPYPAAFASYRARRPFCTASVYRQPSEHKRVAVKACSASSVWLGSMGSVAAARSRWRHASSIAPAFAWMRLWVTLKYAERCGSPDRTTLCRTSGASAARWAASSRSANAATMRVCNRATSSTWSDSRARSSALRKTATAPATSPPSLSTTPRTASARACSVPAPGSAPTLVARPTAWSTSPRSNRASASSTLWWRRSSRDMRVVSHAWSRRIVSFEIAATHRGLFAVEAEHVPRVAHGAGR